MTLPLITLESGTPNSPLGVVAELTGVLRQWLGDEWRSDAITWLITKPLAIFLLLVVAFALRWFLHRLIDRLVQRAIEGLPTPVLRRRREDEEPPALSIGRRV
jgi:hypothetical protein